VGHKIGIFFSREKVLKKEATHGNEESREESRKEKEEVVSPQLATEIV